MKALKLVHPRKAPTATRVDVDISLKGSLLSALYQIRSDRPSAINEELPNDGPQWGLWDWDVVELFVACGKGGPHLPYYEFQVSPLGQHFELEVLEPRKRVNREFRSGFVHWARRLAPGDWDAEIRIQLDRLGWDGDPAHVIGNAFSILGPKESRTYWSLFLDQQEKPDFHLPDRFRSLLKT